MEAVARKVPWQLPHKLQYFQKCWGIFKKYFLHIEQKTNCDEKFDNLLKCCSRIYIFFLHGNLQIIVFFMESSKNKICGIGFVLFHPPT